MFQPCTSPYQPNAEGVALGQQTLFEVRAIDPSGNVDPSPDSRLYVKHGELGVPPVKSRCDPVPLDQVIGKKVEENCRITQIKNGKVPCMEVNTGKAAKCAFDDEHERWLESKSGRDFAVVGDPTAKGDGPFGKYVIAAPIGPKKTSPCADIDKDRGSDRAGRDQAGVVPVSSYELNWTCIGELAGSSWNASGLQMDNFATRPVCMNNAPALGDLISAAYAGSPQPGVTCWMGEGAGLNDVNGFERDAYGVYFPSPAHRPRCHLVMYNGLEVYAAKRPVTQNYPPPVKVQANSPSVWRPVAAGVSIAN